jgi:TRAP-type C4-dicarboxylate transport system substrate-binding protein
MYKKVALALLGSLFAATAANAQTYKFRLADGLPPTHIITRAAALPFMKRVKELTKGQVTFQHFPAGQLGKGTGLLSAAQSGLADIAYVIPSHIPGKMALSAVAELPGGYPDACAGTKALMALALPGGLLDKYDFAPNGMRVLVAVVLPPYQAAFSTVVGDLKGFHGKKIRSNPGPMEMSINALGGVPIRMTPSEIYDSLAKGTIDGFYLPYVSIVSYGLDEQVKSATTGANFGSVVITYSMAQKKFAKLPKQIQDALTQAGRDASLAACKQFQDEEDKDAAKLKAKGIQFINFSKMETDALRDKFDHLGAQWAKMLKERGTNHAEEVLKSFRAEVAKITKTSD